MKIHSALAGFALACLPLSASGFGLGLQTSFDQGPCGVIVPRLDYLHATLSSTLSAPGITINASATENITSVAVDYNWFTAGRARQGFYVLGGLGFAVGDIGVNAKASNECSAYTNTYSFGVFPEVGCGFLFDRHYGLELTYKAVKSGDVRLDMGRGRTPVWTSSGVAIVAMTFRF